MLGYKGSVFDLEVLWNQLYRKSCLDIPDLKVKQRPDQSSAKEEPALCQKDAIPNIHSEFLKKKSHPHCSFPELAHPGPGHGTGSWSGVLMYLCLCCEHISFLPEFFQQQAHKKKDCSPNFCSSKRSPIMALLRTSLMKTGCHSMDFCRIRLDLMQLSLYAFTSLFQDDSFSACENSGRWEEKNKKICLKSVSKLLPASMSFE